MIGNIGTVEIKFDENTTYQFTKLYAKDSYNLYLKCLGVLSPLMNDFIKSKLNTKSGTSGTQLSLSDVEFNTEKILNIITEKFSFDEVIQLLKAANIKRNYKDINDAEWNVSSPILIMELFGHVIKINVISELLKSKKDLGQIAGRLFGSENFQTV